MRHMNFKFWRRILAVCVLVLMAVATHAAESSLLLPVHQAQVSYNQNIEYWLDKSNQAELAQAQLAPYVPLNNQVISYSTDAHWFKIKVHSDADFQKNWFLSMRWAPLDLVDVWVVHDKATNYFALGDHRPYTQRMIKSRLPTVPVILEPNENATVYVRVVSTSLILMLGDFWEEDAFYAQEKVNDVLYGLYFGVFIMLSVIFILFGLWLNDRGMLAYSAFVLSFVVNVLAMNGFIGILFPYGTAWLSDVVVGVAMLAVLFFSVMMWGYLLKIKRYYPNLHLCACVIMWFCVLTLPFITGPYYPWIATIAKTLGIVMSIVPAYIAFKTWQTKRHLEYLIYFVSFFFTSVGAIIYLLMLADFINLSFQRGMYYQNSLFLNILVMSVGMAFRIRQIQHDKIEAQNAASLAVQRTQEERRFVAMLSHEFKTPLTVINMSAQMLEITLPNMATKILGRLNNIRTNASRLSSLVDNFLLSEQISNERLPLKIENYALTDLLADIRLQVTDVDWHRICVDCTDDDYAFDISLLSMAIGNLIHNALRYAFANTDIRLSMLVDSQGLSILVSDQGPGVSQEDLALLGTPYYRTTSSMGKKGTGLGYYFSRRIVELHHGVMSASLNQMGGLDINILFSKKSS